MRAFLLVLVILFACLQYHLWLGTPNVGDLAQLRARIVDQHAKNVVLAERNRALTAAVDDLKNGFAEIEARARNELGLVSAGETFYRVVETTPAAAAAALTKPTSPEAAITVSRQRKLFSDTDLGRCTCGWEGDTLRRCDP